MRTKVDIERQRFDMKDINDLNRMNFDHEMEKVAKADADMLRI